MADYRIEMINGFPVIIDNTTNFKNSTTALSCFHNEMIELLEDLYQRLVLDYNGDKSFEQMEEDRFAIDEAIELLRSEKE